MTDETRLKLEADSTDMMRFINMGEEAGSDLELSEDGASSVASSAEFKFDTNDDYEFEPGSFEYNWMPVDAATRDGSQAIVSPGVDLSSTGSQAFNGTTTDNEYTNAQGRSLANALGTSMLPIQDTYKATPSSPQAQELMQRIKFGAFDNPNYPYCPPPLDRELMELDPSQADSLEYAFEVEDFPQRSRVETQIKCHLSIRIKATGAPCNKTLLHLPSDTIARPRFQLQRPEQTMNDEVLRKHTLWLSVEAIDPDIPGEQVLMCPKCLARERRRAFRKKAMDPHEETYWNKLQSRRIIILNCREVVAVNSEGQVDLPLRIACYCRHHAAKNGYQLVFGLRGHDGTLLGKAVTSKVFITDSHKDQRRAGSQSLTSPNISNPATPSSVSSQDSLPLSAHVRRVSSSSSLGLSGQPAPYVQSMHQHQQHHPYQRPSRSSNQQQNMVASNGGGFQHLPSSQLNRQIQSLHAVPSWLAGVQLNDLQPPHQSTMSNQPQQQQQSQQQPQQPQPQPQQQQQQQQQQLQQQHRSASAAVFRVIPQTGSVRGGTEVTLLGQNFHSGLIAMFGETASVHTQCWSDSTIIAQLPPSNQAGPVPVTFQNEPSSVPSAPTFTYVNDSDGKLKELALQMVGYKVTGKIEDAADIAQRIIMNDNSSGKGASSGSGSTGTGSGSGAGAAGTATANRGGPAGFSETIAESAEQLTLWILSHLDKIGPGRTANLNLRNSEGQCMIHLASILGYPAVVKALIANGAYVDIQDVNGFTPLHFAVLNGNRNITRLLLLTDADPFHRTLNGLTALDLTDVTVEDLLPKDQRAWYSELNRRGSSSSIASMIQEWREEAPAVVSDHLEHRDEQLSASSEEPDANVIYKKPPSYSQLFPPSGLLSPSEESADLAISETELLSQPLTKTAASRLRRRSRGQAPVIDIEVSNSDGEGEEEDDEEDDDEGRQPGAPQSAANGDIVADDDGEEGNDTQYLQQPYDKMLFTFWIPLSLLTILGITAIYVVQNYGRSDAHPLAIKLGDSVTGMFSNLMDRFMPLPRWTQAPNHAGRPAQQDAV